VRVRRAAVTGRRARSAVLVVALALAAALPAGTATAQPLEAAPPFTSTEAPAYDVSSYGMSSDAATIDVPLDLHDEADLAARGDGSVPEFMSPVVMYETTAVFGERGRHWTTRHTGLDFKAPRGTPVYAVHGGTVVKLAWHKAYGRMVILEVAPGVTVWYCHLSAVTVKLGPVQVGQQLGRIGSSGNAFGPHLHLEVRVDDRPTDPAVYLFGTPPGTTSTPPSWLPPKPVVTVANLTALKHTH
jgi:murein DD-endopeptidase MepM/ murein hydrolase activator NlpD